MWSLSTLPGLLLLWTALRGARAEEGSSEPKSDFVCQHPPYKTKLVSASPLVIYLEDFLTPEERRHLYAVSKGQFSHPAAPSDSHTGTAAATAHHVAQTAQTAYVPRDAVLHCIEERAAEFQGYDVSREQLEPLQLVRYGPGERHDFHTDWIPHATEKAVPASVDSNGGNRLSSFFAYVYLAPNDTSGTGGTTGGGTNFPLLTAPADERWCTQGLIDCDEPWEHGVTFRPVAGNAIFWRNLRPDASPVDGVHEGDYRTLHAGRPVTSGEEIGLNIWTREGWLSEETRGPEFYPDV